MDYDLEKQVNLQHFKIQQVIQNINEEQNNEQLVIPDYTQQSIFVHQVSVRELTHLSNKRYFIMKYVIMVLSVLYKKKTCYGSTLGHFIPVFPSCPIAALELYDKQIESH